MRNQVPVYAIIIYFYLEASVVLQLETALDKSSLQRWDKFPFLLSSLRQPLRNACSSQKNNAVVYNHWRSVYRQEASGLSLLSEKPTLHDPLDLPEAV